MKRAILLLIGMFLAAVGAAAAQWDARSLEQPRLRNAFNYVSNPDGILSAEAVTQINALATDIENQTGAQLAVAVVDDYRGADIDSFATDLFGRWGIGQKGANNGVLLVVAVTPREYAFRTGRGIGSVVTDVETARIADDYLIPNFRAGDYSAGTVLAVRSLHDRMTSPEAKAELLELRSRFGSDDQTLLDVVIFYLWCAVILTVVLALWTVYRVSATRKDERHRRYVTLHPMLRILYGLGFVGVGIPFLVYLPFREFLKNLRDGEHLCPNCGHAMHKLDEIHDNERLTPAQDAEERYNSVDYDVWECPNCGEEDVYAFENRDSDLTECAHCHAKTARYIRTRVLVPPTTQSEGVAAKEFQCLNCGKITQRKMKIPRKPDGAGMAAAAAIPFILGSMGRGGGGGFGGGGSFGGGLTGGGGSSGRW